MGGGGLPRLGGECVGGSGSGEGTPMAKERRQEAQGVTVGTGQLAFQYFHPWATSWGGRGG